MRRENHGYTGKLSGQKRDRPLVELRRMVVNAVAWTLQITFVILWLSGIVDWPWWLVFSPVITCFTLAFFVLAIAWATKPDKARRIK
ncbi:MAG: hypothetical protein JRC86_13135 [Deltaproteobacteria bacterium]|nr:hypothetical protein [Deltaproteobacteria bacterium]